MEAFLNMNPQSEVVNETTQPTLPHHPSHGKTMQTVQLEENERQKLLALRAEARPKQGEDIQSTDDDDDTLVITIVIILHGCVTTMEVGPTNYNIRYISDTGDKLANSTSSRKVNREALYDFNDSLRKDTPADDNDELQKDDKLQKDDELQEDDISYGIGLSINQDAKIQKDNELPRRRPYFDSLPYDKTFTVIDPRSQGTWKERACYNFERGAVALLHVPDWMTGIWVISVHKRRKPHPINDYKYVYPEDKDRFINLLNLRGLEDLNENFNKIPDLKNTILREGTRIHEGLEPKLINIILNDDNTRIEYLRLSYLLELLKQIIGPKCGFNIYDYSCSNACDDSSITDTKTTTSLIDGREAGKRPFFGGRKRKSRKTKRRRSRKYKRSKRKTRSKRPRGGQQNNKRRL